MKKALPYACYFIPVLVLTLIGIGDSSYLVVTHYRNYTDLAYSSFCALSKAFNCDTVAQSPFSMLLGLPLALWGFLSYCAFLALLLTVRKRVSEHMAVWGILLLLSFTFSCFSLYLGYISATKIYSYCILCLISYAVSFSLFFFCLLIRNRFVKQTLIKSVQHSILHVSSKPYFLNFFLMFIIVSLAIRAFLPHYWDYTATPLDTKIRHGFTDDGHPWIGAENPRLIVEEYSDYECFQCYKMHFFLRRLVEHYPDRIRLVHHNYPMDNVYNPIIVPSPFHVGSRKLALLAIYSATQGKFWETNDALYTLGRKKEPFNTRTLAQETGLSSKNLVAALYSPEIKQLLTRDIWQGMKLRIMGTPAFVINGKVYESNIPSQILSAAMQ